MTSYIGLPRRQAQCLHAIERHILEKLESPTLDEIAAAMSTETEKVSKQHVHELVGALAAKGRITRDHRKHRSIEIVEGKRGLKI